MSWRLFLQNRPPWGTSSLIERILGPDSMLSRLEREKDCGSFRLLFQKLRETLQSFADKMSLNRGRRLEDLYLEHLSQDVELFPTEDVVCFFRYYARRAEDIIEKVSTEIALHHKKGKREEEDASARRSTGLRLRLRLPFSEGKKYRGALDGLYRELDEIVSRLRLQLDRIVDGQQHVDRDLDAPWNDSSFREGLGSSQQARVGFPQYARGMDSDLQKEVLTSLNSPITVMTPTCPFDRPVDVADTWLREEDLKAIIMRLLSSDEDHIDGKNDKVPVPAVLPIVGVPGVGKTTLAWLLYFNNHQVSTHFRRRLWLDVSKGFDLDLIAQAIEAIAIKLRWWIPDQQEVDQENPSVTGNDAARRHMFVKILGRNVQHRYLIILDGLKHEDRHKWLAFREFLKGTGSHVIITARHRAVINDDSAVPYVLQGLPELHSWQYLSANHTLPKPLPRFLAHVMYCSAGVPLALNLLRHYMDPYLRILDCKQIVILPLLPDLADDMCRDLFANLPDHLRNCFAYCSLFPSGYEMDKSTLIQLWMAQGFIPTQSDLDAEDLGDAYFRDLLERSLLGETNMDEFGNIRSCKMHELSLLIAYDIINKDWLSIYSPTGLFDWAPLRDRHYLHVSQGSSFSWLDEIRDDCHVLRTLLVLDQQEFAYSSPSPSLLEERLGEKLRKFPFLRVLDLHKLNVRRVPTSINEMKLLKYLDLSGNPHVIMLPDSITWLIHLQTLKLSHCEQLKELPKDIARLENLRHLEIEGCLGLTHMPRGIGQLTALKTLSMFVVGDESGTSPGVGELSELKALNQLRGKLELRCLGKARSLSFASLDLEKKEYLESVALVGETTDAEDADGSAGYDEKTLEGLRPHKKLKGLSIHGYGGVNFPQWISTLSNLIKITVKDCHSCQSLPPLHQLPHLKYLILENMCSLEYIIPDKSPTALEGFQENSAVEGSSHDAISFPSLIHLSLKELPKLKGCLIVNDATSNPNQVPTHSFPVLSHVTLDDCCQESNLTLPPAIEELHVCRFSKKKLGNLLLQSPLPRLTSLCISSVKDLDYLPKTWFSSPSSINNLELRYCPNLSCLPTFLVSLKSLSVISCDGFTSFPSDIQCLQALETLKVKYCFKLDLQKSHNHVKPHNDIDLKWWPQFDLARNDHGGYLQVQEERDSSYFAGLKSLSYLEVKRLPRLVSLPDSICELQSLHQLCLSCCDSLKYLPEGMQRIPNLYKIKISGCPLLKERCRDKTSGEWEKMCHIWDRDLDWDEDLFSLG